MREFAGLVFTPEQFALLAEYCREDAAFPDWDGWNDLVSRANAAALAGKGAVAPLAVDSAHFRRWCTRVDIVPCLDALRAYAIVQRSPHSSSRYGGTGLDSRPAPFDT